MSRFFNVAGPCDAREHYMLGPEARIPDLLPLIERKQYFVLHAARQTGKTTAMRAFAARLRDRGYVALWVTFEEGQPYEDVARAEPVWLRAIYDAACSDLPESARPVAPDAFRDQEEGNRLRSYLEAFAQRLDRPLVLLIDEADVVRGPALVSLLRQLRAGYMRRDVRRFPTSVVLIGMRDLRDYLTASKDGVPSNPGSPFNVKSDSITLRNFTAAEVVELLGQHTSDTGQVFTDAASTEIFRLTQGQPFLVNALARQCVDRLVTDRSVAIDVDHVQAAKEALILSRTTHLDSLAQRLLEPRVARIVEAVVLGDEAQSLSPSSDDFQYVLDLGLLRKGPDGVEPANPIYREVLARQLSYDVQENLRRPWWRWSTPEGRLDFPALIEAFRGWWRENADVLRDHAGEYPEAVPHLALMAFVQRVVNGGGRVHREFSAGRGALDLCVEYGGERFAIEVKRIRARDGLEKKRAEGIVQLCGYLDTLGLTEGWLVLFDVREGRTWDDRLWSEDVVHDGKTLHLVGA
jgi:type II secretory pathway predicted ATPase ExeA